VVRHQLVRYKESARVGGAAGFEPVKNSIVLARPYRYTKGPLPGEGSVSGVHFRKPITQFTDIFFRGVNN